MHDILPADWLCSAEFGLGMNMNCSKWALRLSFSGFRSSCKRPGWDGLVSKRYKNTCSAHNTCSNLSLQGEARQEHSLTLAIHVFDKVFLEKLYPFTKHSWQAIAHTLNEWIHIKSEDSFRRAPWARVRFGQLRPLTQVPKESDAVAVWLLPRSPTIGSQWWLVGKGWRRC